MFWRVVMWPLRSGTYLSITSANASSCSGVTPPNGKLDPDHLHVGLALAVDALLQAELDELVALEVALAGSGSTRCRSRRTRARGSGSRARERSRAPRGSRAIRCVRCASGFPSGRGRTRKCTKRQSAFRQFAGGAGLLDWGRLRRRPWGRSAGRPCRERRRARAARAPGRPHASGEAWRPVGLGASGEAAASVRRHSRQTTVANADDAGAQGRRTGVHGKAPAPRRWGQPSRQPARSQPRV